jgi:hypothetical protein
MSLSSSPGPAVMMKSMCWSHQLGGHCDHSTGLVVGILLLLLLLSRRGKLRRNMYATGPRAKLGFRVTPVLVNITYIPTVCEQASENS